MKKYGLNELREMFLSFFETKDHLRLPSFSLVPQNDKSVLLINAGMTPMKPWFKGEEEPPRRRVCTCQKCIRTGDIENVGHTARHGTYFEMLGNFSFGDYFKKEAIEWSWEFLTSPDWVGLDPNRLYPSVYKDDDEAWDLWHDDIGIPAEKIFRFGKEDNFWEHGSGPCGPCSEIYYDRGEQFGCGKPDCTVGCDCDRYIEVWNNVFSQFDNDGKGNYTELKQKNIDTGMGLERLAVVCQEVNSLFEVDTVMNITKKVSELTGAYYGKDLRSDVSLRVITDHIRSSVFMTCDGILPSNEGRGYVLRRLLRRAARHGKLLGVNEPFLYRIVETVVHENECQYPELREKQRYIENVIESEENSFAKTIDGGLKIFADLLAEHKNKGETVFSGSDAFKLYDTYGFPIDLTSEMCTDNGMSVDSNGFEKLMNEQRERAREARKKLGDLGWAGIEFGKQIPDTVFCGYDSGESEAEVLAIVFDNEFVNEVSSGQSAIIVLDKTVMYAEMGGQVNDTGSLSSDDAVFKVDNVQKNNGGKYMHYGVVTSGHLRVGDRVKAVYDKERRSAVARAHTATHILQKALKEVLGEHVHQAGSLVEPDFLRFDFAHFSPMSEEEIRDTEKRVNRAILRDFTVETEVMSLDEARKSGATALFGEKYGATVRVVNVADYSSELCGGTHVSNSARIGSFHIISEGSVASGVRRIEAVTGERALSLFNERSAVIKNLSSLTKCAPDKLESRFIQLENDVREAKRVIEKYKDKESAGSADKLLDEAVQIGPVKLVRTVFDAMPVENVRKIGDSLRSADESVVAVMAVRNEDKAVLLCVCGKKAVEAGFNAGAIIKQISQTVGGKGGGKPDSAMGGGPLKDKIPEALKQAEEILGGVK